MIELTLEDGTKREFERIQISREPLPVGLAIETPMTTWKVVECLPRAAGGYWIGMEAAVLHAINIEGKRLSA